ncbi:Recombinase [Entomobacter blattae]|uniref:Recombinase n=2 Tax=Entomobacter blattae TaxID=2762277 RepID=A0A7H1NNP9_9PROT|nr:Recombinase [Entomobacter blattae]
MIDEHKAERIRHIFTLYSQLGCLSRLVHALAEEKGKKTANSSRQTTHPVPSRGALHKILTNPVYMGKISHKGTLHEGKHPAIITPELFALVQDRLMQASARKRGPSPLASSPSWLKGKLRDETGKTLTPSHTQKKAQGTTTQRFRYYLSHRLLTPPRIPQVGDFQHLPWKKLLHISSPHISSPVMKRTTCW